MAGHEHVRLDDEDPQRRNEALLIELEDLRETIENRDRAMGEMARTLSHVTGVQEMGIVAPEEVRRLFAAIEGAIQAFLQAMSDEIRQREDHKAGIMARLNQSNSFQQFRFILQNDPEILSAALDPYTNIIDIWTAYIWKVLYASVLRENAFQSFYNGEGENAAAYIGNVDQIVDLMKQANPAVFGEYARRLWRRQALAAIFRTARFDWVERIRAARIRAISEVILIAFSDFTGPIPQPRRGNLVLEIVRAAVRLSEHIMIEADDVWTIQQYGLTDGGGASFYTNIKDFDLKPAGTTATLQDNVPLDTISDRLSSQDLRSRVIPLCTIAPALRYQAINDERSQYQDSVTLVKPRVLVSLRQAAPAGGQQAPAAAPSEEPIFYTLARNMGLSR